MLHDPYKHRSKILPEFSTGGARLAIARMQRYPSSLCVQESGFHHLIAEANKGRGIPRESLAQEVAKVVANAMASFSLVSVIILLLIGKYPNHLWLFYDVIARF